MYHLKATVGPLFAPVLSWNLLLFCFLLWIGVIGINLQTDSIYRLFMTLLFESKLQNPNYMLGQSERKKNTERSHKQCLSNMFSKVNCSTKNYTIHQNIQNQKR